MTRMVDGLFVLFVSFVSSGVSWFLFPLFRACFRSTNFREYGGPSIKGY